MAVGSGTGTVTAEDASFLPLARWPVCSTVVMAPHKKPNAVGDKSWAPDTYPVISDAKVCNISWRAPAAYHNSGERRLMFTTPVTTTYNGLVRQPVQGRWQRHIYYGSFTVDSLDADLSDYAYTMADSVMTKDGLTYFVINNPMELDWFRYYVNSGNVLANAILTADIDLSSLCGAATATTSSVSWNPIAGSQVYTGHFDGNGHTVKIFISAPLPPNGLALFANNAGTISHLTVSGQGRAGQWCLWYGGCHQYRHSESVRSARHCQW